MSTGPLQTPDHSGRNATGRGVGTGGLGTGGVEGLRSGVVERLTLGAGLGVIDAAHLVICERFEAVARALEDLRESPHGVRETHALRVATRRADAAVVIFAPHLDSEKADKARKRLRELRRAAGAVRACDVQEELLVAAERGTPDPSGVAGASEAAVVAAELMLGRVQHWRERARRGLVEARNNYKPGRARRAGERLVRTAHAALGRMGAGVPAFRAGVGAATAGEAARAAVNGSAMKFWGAVRFAESPPPGSAERGGAFDEFEALHDMRLAGKRLRYIIEVMSACLDEEACESAVSTLRKLQDRLGEVNDRHELAKRTHDAAAELGLSGGLAGGKTARAFVALSEALVASRDALLDDFESWWENKRRKLELTLERLASPPGLRTVPRERRDGGEGEKTQQDSLVRELNEAIDNARSLLDKAEARAAQSPAELDASGNAGLEPSAVQTRPGAAAAMITHQQSRQEATA